MIRRLEGRLSSRAQARLGRSALVYVETDGTYVLEREGQPPLGLGATVSEALDALTALHHAARARDDE